MAKRVTLHFDLAEDVTPELFAGKIASACASGALRPGESVTVEVDDGDGSVTYTVTEDRLIDEPAFDGLRRMAGREDADYLDRMEQRDRDAAAREPQPGDERRG